MSWVIEITDGEFPAKTDAALALLDELREQEEEREFGSPHHFRLTEALPLVIQTATEMGFTVFDGGDDAIHRPKGWREPTEIALSQTRSSKPWWNLW